MRNPIIEEIEKLKIMPVLVLRDSRDAQPTARALIAGGLPAAEVTFRTDAAEASIREITKAFPGMLVGAGSIGSAEQAKRARAAGAKFLVSAGTKREIIEYALDNDIPVFPGICTPTELMRLMDYHLTVAKFFPAEQFGGLNTIKALSGPFPNIRFMPTGGISAANIREYLACPRVIACGGSWMVRENLIAEGKFGEIERLTAEAVSLVKER